jgi:secondary thiamine-phosphate synthase enzyme
VPIFSAAPTACHATIRLTTRHPCEFVDVTDEISDFVAVRRLDTGVVNVQTLHTTTGLIVNELEPLLLQDFAALFERLAPRAHAYAHDDVTRRFMPPGEPMNGHAHCRAVFLPASVSLNVVGGRLVLGQWQRVLLAELDGPRERLISLIGYGDRSQ